MDLFPVEPQRGEVSRLYRRWTFHSAALDLALRQAGKPLHAVLGREPRPLTFVVSLRLGEPPTLEPIERRLAHYPSLRFKLDATSSWTPELMAALARSGAVDSIDFKALYHGTIVDQEPDPVLYARVVEAFPDAWLEDPDVVTDGTAGALAAEHDRITWDAPIHSIADIEALPFPPRMVNIKPSRIGGLRRLCDTYDYCAEHGIGAYGGRPVRAGAGPRPGAVPGVAVSRRHPQRPGAGGLQRERAAAGAAGQPAAGRGGGGRVPLGPAALRPRALAR